MGVLRIAAKSLRIGGGRMSIDLRIGSVDWGFITIRQINNQSEFTGPIPQWSVS
jgi:hypothetical protein